MVYIMSCVYINLISSLSYRVKSSYETRYVYGIQSHIKIIARVLPPCGYKMLVMLMKVNNASSLLALSWSTRGLNLWLNNMAALLIDFTHGFPSVPNLLVARGVHPIWVRANKATFLAPILYKVCQTSKMMMRTSKWKWEWRRAFFRKKKRRL